MRQGTWYFHQIPREAVWRARELFREALKIDPQLPEAHIWLGRVTGALVAYGWSDDRIADLKEGSHAALKAVQLDEQNPYSHYALAVTSVFSGAPGRAILAAETAIKLSPSFALGYLALGFAHLNLGRATDARPRRVVVRKQLRRGQVIAFFAALPPCLIGMEACATAHYWARELTKLGHEVRLMPAKDVKAYVKRNKNDAADAEAICEAVGRPRMRLVRAKSAEQQGRLMQHRARDLLLRQQTQVINALRAHMAELGIVAAQGREGLKQLLKNIADEKDARLPIDARASLIVLAAQLQALHTMIGSIERRIVVQHRANEASKRLECIHGIGVIGASAITATVNDPGAFRSGRDFAAWIGLVPRQDSTGGKQKLGPISKRGDRYLRRILVVGAISVLRRAKLKPEKYPWLTQLLARRPFKVVAIALANKMARIAWALLANGSHYRPRLATT